MTVFARLLREPLVHFILIGAVVFGLYVLVGDRDDEGAAGNRIVVTDGRIQQLAQVFQKTWQRPPTPQELRGLVDAFIKEEVYYREAVKLGLDRDDTLIRRRMQQKMEFLTEPGEDVLKPDDAVLQAYLDKNKDDFKVAPQVAFEQVYIKAKPDDADAKARAAEALDRLKAGEAPDELGDATLLPAGMKLSPLDIIERDFGEAFSKALLTLSPNAWSGPIASPYGLHLVRVSERKDGYDPALAEVRDAVAQRWRTKKREDFQRDAYENLRSQYEVVLPPAKETPTKGEAGE